jgi:DNA-binding NtrC family response regulator
MPEVELPLNLPATATGFAGNSGFSSGLANILVIDDEAAIRESLEVLLTLEGYTVRMAADGVEGLRTLDLETFDLLLLDLNLPGQSGLELLPQIKERQPELPVIMITAYGTVDNVVEAVRAGAENFVQKPWDNENCWPTSAPPSPAIAPKKRTCSSSAPSSSATTSQTSWARARSC